MIKLLRNIYHNPGLFLFEKSEYIKFAVKNLRHIPSLFSHYVKLRIFRKPSVKNIDFALTYECNGKCYFCSAVSFYKPDKSELPLEDIKRVLIDMKRAGIVAVNFTGGEVFLRNDLSEILSFASDLGFIVAVSTNGVLIGKRETSLLRDSGVSIVQFGLFSDVEAEHDKIVGIEGAFRAVVDGAGILKDKGMIVVFNFPVIKKDGIEKTLSSMVRLAQEKKVFLSLIYPIPKGGVASDPSVIPDGFFVTEIEEYQKLPFVTSHWKSSFFGGCPAGIEKVYISAYGDIYPCPYDSKSFGNILSTDVSDIISAIPEEIKYCKVCRALR